MILQEEIITTRWKAFDNRYFLNRDDAVTYEKEYIDKHRKHPVGRRVYFMYSNKIYCLPIEEIEIRDTNGTIGYVFTHKYDRIHMLENEVFSELQDIIYHLKCTIVSN